MIDRDEINDRISELHNQQLRLMEFRVEYIHLVEETPGSTQIQIDDARIAYELAAADFTLSDKEYLEHLVDLRDAEGDLFVSEGKIRAYLQKDTPNRWPLNCIDWDKAETLYLEAKTQINTSKGTWYAVA